MTTQQVPHRTSSGTTINMTPEMCRAIRRQESNSGLDYWKSGFSYPNNPTTQQSLHEKPPTGRRLSHVNFDFPGLFLPNLGTQSLRFKRKQSQPVLLGRSRTSLMPDIKPSRTAESKGACSSNNHTKKATVTDLTCLQLADTLLSYNKPAWMGFSGLSSFGNYYHSPLRTRYTDLFRNDYNDDAEISKSVSTETTANEESDEESKALTFSYQSVNTDNYDMLAGGQNGDCLSESDTKGTTGDVVAKPQIKPQKSILKNGQCKLPRPNSETVYLTSHLDKPSACAYQLPGAKKHVRSMSETRIPSTYPRIYNGVRENRVIRQIPVGHESKTAIRTIPITVEREQTFRDISDRKRSVRFNAAHEVREYAPFEPVSFC